MTSIKISSLSTISVVAFFFVSFSAYWFSVYIKNKLGSNVDHFMLSANRFGVPEELTLHGFAPFFKDVINTGWDGQFYYYISNDIFALRDTPNHIDSDAYRYQRIGFPLLVSFLGNVFFMEWISPTFYLLNYFILTLIAVVIGSAFLHQCQISPYLILLWALFAGTQLCLQNGLIDAAADSFLILALFCSSYSLLFTVIFLP